MTEREINKLIEYRYAKLCRLEYKSSSSRDSLERYNGCDNSELLTNHLYDVIYKECFKNLISEIFELLLVLEQHEKFTKIKEVKKMTYEEYQEFEDYKCNYDCENCQYRSWLGYDWGCILDTIQDLSDLLY